MGIPGAANPLLLRRAAAATEDAYEIKRSLRFNGADNPYLIEAIPKEGNRRKWTFSGWVKRSKFDDENYFYTSRAGAAYNFKLGFDDDALYWYNSSDPAVSAKTNALFRDPSAWYHVVFVWDTNQSIDTERAKLYVNGKRITSFSSATYPPQHEPSQGQGALGGHEIGSYDNGDYYNFEGYIADFHFIDGLALSPAAFGEFDSTGLWNPKAFALPSRNQGVTQTSALTSSSGAFRATAPAADLFDYRHNYGASTSASSGGTITWTPATAMPFTQGVRCKAGESGVLFTLTLADDSVHKVQTASSGSGGTWHTMYEGAGTIKTITCYNANSYQSWDQIEVDGIWIQDSISDIATLPNPNDGRKWSDDCVSSTSGNFYSDGPAANGFDGQYASSGSTRVLTDGGGSGNYIEFTPSGTITWNKSIEVYADRDVSISINGGSGVAVKDGVPKIVATGGGTLTTLRSTEDTGSGFGGWSAIFIDGHTLIDTTVDNSFHLTFEDNSADRYLGKDTLKSKISEATGAKPILTTTDDHGDVTAGAVDTGDSNKSNLVFAWPGNSTTSEVHHTVKGSGSAKTVTVNGDPAVDTSASRLYGSSVAFDRTGDYLSVDGGSDFNLGTGDYCIEGWFRSNDITQNQGLFVLSTTSGGLASTDESEWITGMVASGTIQVRPGDGTTTTLGEGFNPVNGQWFHLAFTRDSATYRVFKDGALAYTKTSETENHGDQYLAIGGYYSTSYLLNGNVQDFRIYKGASKYTSHFICPTRNDFTRVTNLAAASDSGYSSGGNWSGGTAFRKHSRTTWSSAAAWNLSSGDSFNTNGNNKVLYIDRESLGAAFNITIEDTGGANDIYVTEADDGSSWVNTINNQAKIILTESSSTYISTSGTTSDVTSSIKRYLRLEGAGGGYCTMTVSGTAFGTGAGGKDSLTDSPTNVVPTDGDTGVGEEVSGTYCTWNPLDRIDTTNVLLTEGNLKIQTPGHTTSATAYGTTRGTIGVTSGKYYFEIDGYTQHGSTGHMLIGVIKTDVALPQYCGGTGSISYTAYDGKVRVDDNGGTAYGDTFTTGDVIGVALDMDNGAIYFSKNNTWQNSGSPTSGASRTNAGATWTPDGRSYTPGISDFQEGSGRYITAHLNPGNRAFKYTAPTDYKCLCSANLPDLFGANNNTNEDLNDPSKYFDVVKWTGKSGSNQSVTGLKFAPDFVWVKDRKDNNSHNLADRVRGANKQVWTNSPSSEYTYTNSINSLDSNGFTVGTNGNVNTNGNPFLAWCWDAGTAAATASTAGSINPTDEWVNTESGFSIIRFTSPDSSSAQTVGHSLGAVPHFIMSKNLENSYGFEVWHRSLAAGKSLQMNDDGTPSSGRWGSITSTTFGTVSSYTHYSTHKYINWLWTEKPGFSSFGSFEGNENDDGPFVYCGFSPHYVLIKNIDITDKWHLYDTARSTYNPSDLVLFPSLTDAGNTYEGPSNSRPIDILSNGFKLRHDDYINSSHTFVYCAFAEAPFKTARAR